ncbi:MAG: hypothetical protein EU539_00655 [Promethearchaeota archaeon]|nr:MAG: hypothetical protein EU539_00655 [Candidatus Lokiarchaeota archaeon]
MLRQVHVFHDQKLLFSHSLALALDENGFKKVREIIEPDIVLPTPGKTLHRPIANYQIFHRAYGNLYFLLIADLTDSFNYIDEILKKTIAKFNELFPRPEDLEENKSNIEGFKLFLYEIQKSMHSKISIIGSVNSGKSTLYNMLKTTQEKSIMDFAKSTTIQIDQITFDIWDFQLHDNHSLLWSKFIGGSDLVLLLFDSANYNLTFIEHFLNLKKQHAKHSKLLMLANKSDLIREEEIEKIKSLIGYPVQVISLLDKKQAKKIIHSQLKSTLDLLPEISPNLEDLINQADQLRMDGKIKAAIIEYQEIIRFCKIYQNFALLNKTQTKLNQLKVEKKQELDLRGHKHIKKSFSAPEQITFTKKISVKSLPSASSALKPRSQEATLSSENKPAQEVESSYEPKPEKQAEEPKKLFLKPEDIKISLKSKIEKIQKIQKSGLEKLKSTTRNFFDKSIESKASKILGLPEQLQNLLNSKGTELNIELCKEFVEEMKNQLIGPINNEDLELAAEIFFQIENKL